MSMLNLEIATLQKEITQLKENYESAESRLLTISPAEVDTYNALKRKMAQILTEIDKAEQKIKELSSKSENKIGNTSVSISSISTDINIQEETEYLQTVINAYRHWTELYTPLQAEAYGGRARPGAAAAYLQLTAEVFEEISHFASKKLKTFTVRTFDELYNVVINYKRVALIGDPGCGKTTTLERLAHAFVSDAIESNTKPIPVFLRLRDYSGDDFDAFISRSIKGLSIEKYAPHRLVVLFDGLNEIPFEYVAKIESWLRNNPDVLVVVSCRKLEYFERKLPLQRVDILPLDVQRIYTFIGTFLKDDGRDELFWSLAGKDTQRAWNWFIRNESGASFEDFWFGRTGPVLRVEVEKYHIKTLRENLYNRGELPGMLGVVSNPFLLTAVIYLFENGDLPNNKSQLFEGFVRVLLEKRGKPIAETMGRWVNRDILTRALSTLAFQMQRENKLTIERDTAIAIITSEIPTTNVEDVLFSASNARIIEGDKHLQFMHQLLQQYFAAHKLDEDIKNGASAEKFWGGERWWEASIWNETVLFLVGIQEDATDIVRWLLDVNPSLAYRCVSETGVVCTADVLNLLYTPPKDKRYCPIARNDWGLKIAKQGDKRPGIGVMSNNVPDIVWCKVPAGKFQMGGDDEIGIAGASWKGMDIDLSYVYWIAKYPITYLQFKAFVQGDGYKKPEYWTAQGWRWKGSQIQPYHWDEKEWNISNHPVVNITWYEAYAYLAWLNTQLREHSTNLLEDVPKDWEVRLPTESEWEKAARHPDNRKFPWGNKYIPGYANVDETIDSTVFGPYYIGHTTTVGLYSNGAHPNGAHDLSGNVWEWCFSKWNPDYYFPEDNNGEGGDFRVIRGGSWFNSVNFARTATRDHTDQDIFFTDIGLRPVLSIPIQQYPSSGSNEPEIS